MFNLGGDVAKIADMPNFTYKGANRVNGVCRLRLYQVGERRIAIASELIASDGSLANTGLSVTNGIAQIATAIARQYGRLDVLIEHNPPRGGHFHPKDERFDFVEGLLWLPLQRSFTDTPIWRPCKKGQVEALIRERL